MCYIWLTDSYEADLSDLDDDIQDLLIAFLSELNDSEHARNRLFHSDGFNNDPRFNVKAVTCFNDAGYNISRLRPLNPAALRDYRIIYAIDNENDDFYLMAIVTKTEDYLNGLNEDGYDYEPNHSISQRIRADYDAYGLPLVRKIH